MTLEPPWLAYAAPQRPVWYRVVSEDGQAVLQVDEGAGWHTAEKGHRVARRVAELLLEGKRDLLRRREA